MTIQEADAIRFELRELESRLNLLRQNVLTGIQPLNEQGLNDLLYQLDSNVTDALEHLSTAGRVAGAVIAKLEYM